MSFCSAAVAPKTSAANHSACASQAMANSRSARGSGRASTRAYNGSCLVFMTLR